MKSGFQISYLRSITSTRQCVRYDGVLHSKHTLNQYTRHKNTVQINGCEIPIRRTVLKILNNFLNVE